MAADDYLNTPPDQGFPAGLDPASHSGNRPASGARRATPGEVLSQSFQGAQNAGDFLGLDTEFTAHQDPGQGGLDLTQPPGTYAPDAAGYVPEPAPLPEGDAVQDFAQAPSAFDFGEDLGSEESLSDEAEEPARGKAPLLVGALLVAGLVAGGVLYGPGLYSRYLGGGATETASTEVGRKESPTGPRTRPESATATDPEATPVEVATPTTTSEVPPSTVASTSSDAPATTASKPTPRPRLPEVTTSQDTPSGASTPVEVAGPTPSLVAPPRALEFPDLEGSSYQWASADQLELIWRGVEVPMEAVHAPAKTLMPRVGQVRVFTLGGDVFAGRLYAVGQGLVWIDGEPGRIGLDGTKVERIEVLPPDPDGIQLAEGGGAVGGRRVRVKVPGGMLYGSVLKADGEDVMLALETGGRVRVKASDVQDLGSGRAVVVRE
ncbi:MAG TPA: hypothetical protein VF530_05550 [Planctomycetota bacterium]